MNTAKKKILYVITKSNFGGAQRYVYELATGLPKDQYDVAVAFGGGGILKDKLETAGIRTITIDSFQRDISLSKELRSLSELWKLYKAEKPDVVHLNSSKAGGSGALIARFAGVKNIIYTAHGWAFWEPRILPVRALIWLASWTTALLCHKVIMVSEFELKQTWLPFTKHKYSVIHTALPNIEFKTRAEANEILNQPYTSNIQLGTIAELTNNKNLFTAIDAVSEHNKNQPTKIYYTIIGDGELKQALTTHIKKRNAENYVTLFGYLDDARAYLKAFDIFLLPSKKEGLPYAVLEAGAAGLPVIASNVGGIPEVISNDENGLLIDPDDAHTITTALTRLADNDQLRTQFGQALKHKVNAEFNLSKMVEQTTDLY